MEDDAVDRLSQIGRAISSLCGTTAMITIASLQAQVQKRGRLEGERGYEGLSTFVVFLVLSSCYMTNKCSSAGVHRTLCYFNQDTNLEVGTR